MKQYKSTLKNIFHTYSDKGFFHLLSANILIQIVGFASQLFVAGILTPEDIGRIKVLQTFLSVFSIIAGMGINISTLKVCSENRSQAEVKRLFSSAVIFTIATTIVVYLAVLLLNYFELFSSETLIKWLIPIALFPIISNSIFMVFVSYFQAQKEIKIMSRVTMINKIISIAAIVLLAYFFGIKGYYIAYNLSFIIMAFVSYRIIKKDIQFRFSAANLKSDFKIHFKYAQPALYANLLAELSAYIDIFIINYLVQDLFQIGQYSFALTLTVALRIFPSTVQQIASPYFSSLSDNLTQFKETFRRYNRQLIIGVVVTFIVSLVLISPVLHFLFDTKYDDAIFYFYLLSIGWSIRVVTYLQSAAIFGLGKIKYNVYISGFSLLFNIFLYSFAIIQFGILGVAYSSIASGIAVLLLSAFFFRKALVSK